MYCFSDRHLFPNSPVIGQIHSGKRPERISILREGRKSQQKKCGNCEKTLILFKMQVYRINIQFRAVTLAKKKNKNKHEGVRTSCGGSLSTICETFNKNQTPLHQLYYKLLKRVNERLTTLFRAPRAPRPPSPDGPGSSLSPVS